MGKFIKIALVFMGGMTAGGYCVMNAALKSEFVTTALKDAVQKKVIDILSGPEFDRQHRTEQKVSYTKIYGTSRKPERINRCLENFDDVSFAFRQDAENVLSSMAEIVNQYGYISLSDAYELAGITSLPYAANKYGWQSVGEGRIFRCRDGYCIRLPEPIEIK